LIEQKHAGARASNSLIIGNSEGNEEIGKPPFLKKFSVRKGIVVT